MDKAAAKERLSQAFAYLRKYSPDLTLSDLARETKLSPATVRNAFAPHTGYLTVSFLETFASSFAQVFNREWVLTGELPVLVPDPELPDPELSRRWQRVAFIMKREKMDASSFTKKLGLSSPTTVMRIQRGLTKPQDKTLELILKRFPDYTDRWLFLGLGKVTKWDVPARSSRYVPREEEDRVASGDEDPRMMSKLLALLSQSKESTAGAYIPRESTGYEVMDDTASAGSFRGFVETFPDEVKTLYNIPIEKFHSGEYRLFRVKGESMDGGDIMDLANGDLVLVRNVDRTYWRDGLHRHNWRYFVFVTIDDGIVIKEVVDQDLEKDLYTLHSHNPDYKDFTLHGSQILAIYNVIQVVERRLNR
ncbi:MAG: S24 family peptidase [Porphyromonas sp.]|nr:S24 family peptidase [Bacteroidales bacterium]MDY3100784.1 S24 family peptidase [Porphyromonas sp.]